MDAIDVPGPMGVAGAHVLVTGGAGFIGANLVRMLLAVGCEVTVLDDLSTGRRGYLEGLPLRFISGSILDEGCLKSALEGQSHVVHLAAEPGVEACRLHPDHCYQVNSLGTLRLLEAWRSELAERRGARVGMLVLASTCGVLGPVADLGHENLVPHPVSIYAASKLSAESLCAAYSAEFGMRVTALRFSNAYGPFSAYKSSVVAAMARQALLSSEVWIEGDGRQTRDLLWVGDLCRAVVLVLFSDQPSGLFHVSTGAEVAVLDVAAALELVLKRRLERRFRAARPADVRRSVVSSARLRAALGWRPEVALSDGLQRTIDWLVAHGQTDVL